MTSEAERGAVASEFISQAHREFASETRDDVASSARASSPTH